MTEAVCSQGGFSDKDHALFIICQAINSLPRDQGYTMPSYLIGCIRRSLAGEAAAKLGASLSMDLRFRELHKMHQQEPTDFQIRDEIQKLADHGHKAAKDYMDKING